VIELQRHTLAHVLAQAVREHLEAEGHAPTSIRLGIGPVIEHGFYYDFDLPRSLTPDDLERDRGAHARHHRGRPAPRAHVLSARRGLERYRRQGTRTRSS
jgi:threonyl-tRNA synthetase